MEKNKNDTKEGKLSNISLPLMLLSSPPPTPKYIYHPCKFPVKSL
jgi:hypothetical protein